MFYTIAERSGASILYRGYDASGQQFIRKEEFRPIIYLPAKNGTQPEFTSLFGVPCESYCPGTIRDADKFIEKYRDVENFEYFGMTNWVYNFLSYKFPGEIKYDFNFIRKAFIDIEVGSENGFPNITKADEEVLSITLTYKDKYIVFGFGNYTPHKENISYVKGVDEKDMLNKFVEFWQKMSFDIVSGWHSEGFDIPYLVNRMTRVFGEDYPKKLSPWKKIYPKKIPMGGNREFVTYEISGVNHIDLLQAYKKYSLKEHSSYKLNSIAEEEKLSVTKLDYSEYGSLHQLYKKNYQKFIEYNIRDNEILVELDKKHKLLELIMDLTYYAKVNVQDTFRQTVMWDCIVHYTLLEKGIVIPQKTRSISDRKIAGGFVKDVVPGMYDWIVTLDADSLYPSLMINYNISPETFVERISIDIDRLVDKADLPEVTAVKEVNHTITGNGSIFHKEKRGILPELMIKLFDERRAYKVKMLELKDELNQKKKDGLLDPDEVKEYENDIAKFDTKQKTKKVCLNALFGSLANAGFRYFYADQAEAITMSGQLAIRWAARKINEYLNGKLQTTGVDYILASDTDSVFINCAVIVQRVQSKAPEISKEKIIDTIDRFISTSVTAHLKEAFDELAEYMNAYEQRINFKRESIIERGLFTAKKRYVFLVNDEEGVRYNEPEIKVKGIEIVRSDTPIFCREKLKEAAKIILTKDEASLKEYITTIKDEFHKLPVEDISLPSGVNGIEDYIDRNTVYKKGTPIHVRGSILYNDFLIKKNLEKVFETIKSGGKIKYTYLKMPNPIGENVMAFNEVMPREFELQDYIDYDMMFEKTFMSPLNTILTSIQWNISTKTTLEDFFS